jgi:predicted ATP-grasp superfamily ATP-dependent carboligase
MSKQPACLIVDPVVAPITLTEALLQEGIAPIAILSNTWSSREWYQTRMHGGKFEKIIEGYTPQQIEELPKQIKEYEILACIYGGDLQTVANTDAITQRYFPQFANSPNSEVRMDKYAMHEACRAYGIKAARQLRVAATTLTAAEEAQIKEILPVVVKPSKSAASQGVSVCKTIAEVTTALTDLLGTTYNATGEVEEVTIQEQLLGSEYFVDTVSIDGKHYPCAVIRYHKQGFIYRYADLIDPESAEGQACINYVLSVLEATGMRHGLAHTEIFLTPTGPCLIEINPRISGVLGLMNKLAKRAYGMSQAELFAKLLKNPKTKGPLHDVKKPHYGVAISLQNWTPRKIGTLDVAKLEQLHSFYYAQQMKPAGTEMGAPTTLHDLVGIVLLYSDSAEQVEQDTKTILKWDEAGQLF